MKNTYAIGDIHGAAGALEQLLRRMPLQENDTLIFLGDYVDGWPQSAQVLETLIRLKKKFDCIFLKGNHDLWCQKWLEGAPPNQTWLLHGGIATVDSYDNFADEAKQNHLDLLKSMEYFYVDENNRLFIHAGFKSEEGPMYEGFEHNATWDRTLWELALKAEKKQQKTPSFPGRLSLFHEIYIGHTPTLGLHKMVPANACNVWNIDTGAAFYGPLSAINVGTKAIYQSDIVQLLYPGEIGRVR
ncbi:MAG: metallophosphoesterase family protein [Edaphocola sp.]